MSPRQASQFSPSRVKIRIKSNNRWLEFVNLTSDAILYRVIILAGRLMFHACPCVSGLLDPVVPEFKYDGQGFKQGEKVTDAIGWVIFLRLGW